MGYDIRRWCLERQNRSAAVNQTVLDYTLSFGSLRTNSFMIFGQRLLFLHAGDDLFFKMGEIPDLFLECFLDIFGPVQVQAIDADHVRGVYSGWRFLIVSMSAERSISPGTMTS